MLKPKINANQTRVDSCGSHFKHLVVTLRGDQQIADVLQAPDAWAHVQQDQTNRLRKGDRITVISPDGNVIADQAMVIKAEAGHLWFTKPLRMVTFEEVGLFTDGTYAVEPVGVGYSIKSVRDGRVESPVFATVKAAEVEILKRQPTKAA